MCEADHAFDESLSRARGDYLEMPGLHLSVAQAARLWSLHTPVCEALLSCLVASGFLRTTEEGRYARAISDDVMRPRFRRAGALAGAHPEPVSATGEGERDDRS